MKNIGLVVIRGGVPKAYTALDSMVYIINMDNIDAGGPPTSLPANKGFDLLCKQAGLAAGVHYTFSDTLTTLRHEITSA